MLKKVDGNTTLRVQKDSASGHLIGVSAEYSDNSGALDAFGRLRVSHPRALLVSHQNLDNDPIRWQNKTTGNASATYDYNRSSTALSVEAGGSAIRQSKRYTRYQPGKSHNILATFVGGASANGLTQRVGYFDANDGLFFERKDGVNSVVRRSSTSGSPVNTVVPQSEWNLDPLDGTGDSGITLNAEKAQILDIDMEWLGVGRARMGFIIQGKHRYVHEFNHGNNLDAVYMRTGELPARYEAIGGSSLSGSGTLECISTAIISEGGAEREQAFPFSISNGPSLVTVSNNYIPILSIRPRALTEDGKINRAQIIEDGVEIFSEDNPIHFELIAGASLDNASWVHVNSDFSHVEYDVSATTYSGGIVLRSGYAGGGKNTAARDTESVTSDLPMALDIDGNHPGSPLTDVLTVAATRVGVSDSDISAEISWTEMS